MKNLVIKLLICCTFAFTLLVSGCSSSENKENTSTENTSSESNSAESTTPQSSSAESSTANNTASSTTATAGNVDLETGKRLYSTNCAVCHKLDKEVLIGPGLAGITERRTQEWLIPWIKNSQKVIESGDKYAVELFNKYNKVPMPAYESFSDDEIKSIIAYIEQNQVK